MTAASLTGRRFQHWTVIQTDASGRRVLARCCCGKIKQLAIEALANGSAVSSCGRQPLSSQEREASRLQAARQAKENDQ